jgi:protein tyrosine phosphatase (PTP) superfamily phosphohydrolase (DUF442 family)
MRWTVTLAPAVLHAVVGCAGPGPAPSGHAAPARESVAPPTVAATSPTDAPGLHNVVAYGPGLWSGSVPEGDAGFATLRAWGVRTVISVDGAEPDLARAQAAGIRYVHLPIGYNGFDEARKLELARAVHDLPGPIYVHCHHGKHRSAGAAATVAVALGLMGTEQAIARMHVSGTAPGYKGLYACAAGAQPLSDAQLREARVDVPAVTRPNGFVAAMVSIDEELDHLKAIEAAGWSIPADHPDLVPVAVAGAIADHFRLLQDDKESKARPQAFRDMLAAAARDAQAIEDVLATPPSTDGARAAALAAPMRALAASCKDCHVRYRD